MIGPASIKPLQFSYWVGVKEALEAAGVEVLIGRVPASASFVVPCFLAPITPTDIYQQQVLKKEPKFSAI